MRIFTLLCASALLSACNNDTAALPDNASQQDIFFARLSSHCGQSYAGELVSDDRLDKAMQSKPMVISFNQCSDTQVRIPFHIERNPDEWDRSRTWVITRNDKGLTLKHDHRHEDGSSDKITQYGGDTIDGGTAELQQFPADQESIDLFTENNMTTSNTNIWSVGITDGDNATYSYQLERINRKFRVEFDLTKPIETPPPAWGDEAKADK